MFRAIDSTFLSNCTLSAHCRISGDHYISRITEEALNFTQQTESYVQD